MNNCRFLLENRAGKWVAEFSYIVQILKDRYYFLKKLWRSVVKRCLIKSTRRSKYKLFFLKPLTIILSLNIIDSHRMILKKTTMNINNLRNAVFLDILIMLDFANKKIFYKLETFESKASPKFNSYYITHSRLISLYLIQIIWR